jgi:hypothetical protein
MSTITDLDALAPEPIQVRLGGEIYLLPGDLPMPLMLRIEQLADQELSEQVIRSLYDDVLELFQTHQPEVTDLPIGLVQLMRAIPAIYGGATQDPPRPQRQRPAGTRSTSSAKPKTRSRS